MLAAALIVVSVAGLALSVHTTRVMRCGPERCDLVMTSPYARLFGFPNSIIAIAWFAVLIAFGAARLAGVAVPLWPVLAGSAASLLMSAYLAWALLAKLRRF